LGKKLAGRGVNSHQFSFPRYQVTKFGAVVGEYLNGNFGNAVAVHPKLAAMLYACDRFESREDLLAQMAARDVVVCDRYVPSNLAHQCAKLKDFDAAHDLCQWLNEVEYDVFRLPVPDLVIQLDLPVELAVKLIAKKNARSYTAKPADNHEADHIYLNAVRGWYDRLPTFTRFERWTKISVNRNAEILSVEEVAEKVWEEVSKIL
jgi:dTMP kinase